MKLISLNIELNRHLDLVIPFIQKENPDVVCLQEVLEEDFEKIKKAVGLDGVHKSWFRVSHPNYIELNGKRQGVAILAKNIVSSDFVFYEGSESNIDISTKNQVLLSAEVAALDGKKIRVCTTHVHVTNEGEATPYQLEIADLLLKTLEPMGELVLCGDMNAPRGRETFSRISSKYKDNIPAEYVTSIDQNLHRVRGIMLMVDGLFTTPSISASNVRLVDGVSDHMAVIADISIL